LARARVVKVNPDSPQRPVRELALRAGKLVLVPTPRLRGQFYLLDSSIVDPEYASSISGFTRVGERVDVESAPNIDLVVVGSVAVSPSGFRGMGLALMFGVLLADLLDSDKETAKKARGRPDISLWKIKGGERKVLLVIECKFSDDPNYLTAGRFKAMAYLYEYGALAGALYALFNVFPPLVNALWGLCVLGQSVVPMRRIMEMEVTGRQELKAMAR
jgi:hypothetical protein